MRWREQATAGAFAAAAVTVAPSVCAVKACGAVGACTGAGAGSAVVGGKRAVSGTLEALEGGAVVAVVAVVAVASGAAAVMADVGARCGKVLEVGGWFTRACEEGGGWGGLKPHTPG
jgi:hypothetical protein